ncbi:G-protein coupled receptor moody isoform X1 [Vespa velutina]|uniref:G-protein coupled receptor moody isoform X1 n=3 Tax=Vespa velutina TaxID=202808 RepID=UPI001FB32C5F|nr:G-protein coupled receptor moody isoform X1 [Vespa velutina]
MFCELYVNTTIMCIEIGKSMLEYWMGSNKSDLNRSNVTIEQVLQDPGSVVLFIGYPPWLLYFAAGCCILFMLIGIPGNLITVAALFRTKKLKNATAIFIMNLSFSDLLFCCFNLPLATSTFWHGYWLHGALLCRLFPLLRYGLVAVSLFTVLSIAINRYVMIGHPRLYPKLYKSKYLIPMVLATWILGFSSLIVTWFGHWGRFGLDPAIGSCSILPDVHGRNPKEFLFVLAFLTPCVAIVVCYARIFYIVRKTASKSGRQDKVSNTIDVGDRNREQRSVTPRYQEEELSMLGSSCVAAGLCVSFSNRQTKEEQTSRIFNGQTYEESSLGNPPSSEEDSSRNEENDLQEESSIGHDPSVQDKERIAYEGIEDIPFADDRDADISDTNIFLSTDPRKIKDFTEKPTLNAKKRLEGMASRASFVVESTLWIQRITESGTRLERSETFASSRSSNSDRRMKTRGKVFRRESKFKSLGRLRNMDNGPRMSRKDKKLLKMILVIFSSFLICYLPITVTKLFKEADEWRGLNIAGYILIYLTTCINPVVYVVMSSEYRSAYKNMLLCRNESVSSAKMKISHRIVRKHSM